MFFSVTHLLGEPGSGEAEGCGHFSQAHLGLLEDPALSSGIAVGGMVSGSKRIGQGALMAPGFCSCLLSIWALQLVKAPVCHCLEDRSGAVSSHLSVLSCSFILKHIQVLGKMPLGEEKKKL